MTDCLVHLLERVGEVHVAGIAEVDGVQQVGALLLGLPGQPGGGSGSQQQDQQQGGKTGLHVCILPTLLY